MVALLNYVGIVYKNVRGSVWEGVEETPWLVLLLLVVVVPPSVPLLLYWPLTVPASSWAYHR